MTATAPTSRTQEQDAQSLRLKSAVELEKESVAGEEDPGAALDLPPAEEEGKKATEPREKGELPARADNALPGAGR